MIKPLISYPGAKWKLFSSMVDYFPTDMEVFIEPFLGGGSVTLSVLDDGRFTNLKRVITGDLFPEVWAMWEGVRTVPDEVVNTTRAWYRNSCPTHMKFVEDYVAPEHIRGYLADNPTDKERFSSVEQFNYYYDMWEKSVEEGKKLYEWMISLDGDSLTIGQRAARTILVHRMSFSGLGFSGTFGGDSFCGFREEFIDRVWPVHNLIKNIEIYNVSFEETMKYAFENPAGTFVFLDPPYYNQASSGLYGKDGSTHKTFPHEKFAETTLNLPCNWLVTYDDSIAVRKLFSKNMANGQPCCIMPFVIPGAYTLAGKVSEDALKGEEIYISNMNLYDMNRLSFSDF